MNNIKAVIFDYGYTLHDREKNEFFHDAQEVVKYCANKYRLAIVSITYPQTMEERKKQLSESGLDTKFEFIELVPDKKDEAFERTVRQLNLPFNQIAIVDDRTIRGIKWGNSKGCLTIWLKKGKFAHEVPTEETGPPNYTIKELSELKGIL